MAPAAHGELEADVLRVLWSRAEPMTPREVRDELAGVGRDLSYTTVMTVLVRLWNKGALERAEHGRSYAYRPLLTRDEATAVRMRALLAAAGDRGAALSRFVDSMDDDEKAVLRRILARRRRDA